MKDIKLIKNENLSKMINFTKMNGSHNDFVIIDNRQDIISNRSDFAKFICQRRVSVGADGLILIENSKKADFKMRILNPDGSEAEMCGNGARCAALYGDLKLGRRGLQDKVRNSSLKIETKAGILSAKVFAKDIVKLKMSKPIDLKLNLIIKINNINQNISYINTGVPHTVLFVSDIDKINVYNVGKKIRYHPYFKPQGSNIDFIKVKDKNSIYMRTYERGVENETLACGTGAVASAIIACLKKEVDKPVNVYTRGGEILKIYFKNKGNEIYDVYLEGRVKLVYEGTIIVGDGHARPVSENIINHEVAG